MFKGSKVLIGPLVPNDSATLFRWVNDVDAVRQDGVFRPTAWAQHQNWFLTVGGDTTKAFFAIRLIGAEAIIGHVSFSNINSVSRSAELGVRIGEEANRGKGYGSEAMRLILAHGWNDLNLNRVWLTALSHNRRAIGAYRKVGFRKEGLFRRAVFIDGAFRDMVPMAMLRPALRRRAGVVAASTAVAAQ